ncbi:divergent polysaccharide deacetylase family protein [Roseococcus sp. DSY-14]|uniref:divergent polysaccharide deacetylase family protein n=1 Tax=Roseococcus sp. DSY-14 TaxID=3369650 RepID=UPI00387ADA8A
MALRVPGWRALAGFWLVILLLLGGGAAVLAWLGPPGPRATAAAPEATPAPPAPAAPVAPLPPAAALPTPPAGPLPPMVERDLVENSAWGLLPRAAPDGRSPMLVYSRPFDQREARPRIALIVGGLGMNAALTEQAIAALPPATGLAFSPYASWARPLIEQARARGFETLLALPLEPTGFPLNDPGDRALLTVLPPGENANRLDWLLSRFPGHAGAVGALGPMRGERFAAAPEPFGALQEALGRRGLLYFDPRPGSPPPGRALGRGTDLVVDEPATRGEIEARLAQLERVARERGSALGYVGDASPVAVGRIAAWAAGLEGRGLVLAPPSALVRIPLPGATR